MGWKLTRTCGKNATKINKNAPQIQDKGAKIVSRNGLKQEDQLQLLLSPKTVIHIGPKAEKHAKCNPQKEPAETENRKQYWATIIKG